jgi:hypothetical protein
MQLAMVLRNLATENKAALFRRVLKEYEEADHHSNLPEYGSTIWYLTIAGC